MGPLGFLTVRNIWIKENTETRYKRLTLRLQEERNCQDVALTEEQIKLLEKANPCFRERNVENPYPEYLLCQDTFLLGTLKGIGRIYLQTVIDDTYRSFALGKLYTSKLPETAVNILYDRILPFCEEHAPLYKNPRIVQYSFGTGKKSTHHKTSHSLPYRQPLLAPIWL